MSVVHNGVGSTALREAVQRTLNPSPDRGVNVGRSERLLSAVTGIGLAALGWRVPRSRVIALPLAAGLIGRAVTGRSVLNRLLRRNSARPRSTVSPVASIARGEGLRIERRIVIDRPAEQLYTFWRNFENLPLFMPHVEAVTSIGERRSHWVVQGLGGRVEWDAEVHHEIPGRLIAWRTLPGAGVDHAGSVHFTPSPTGKSTEVRVILRYGPATGLAGVMLARLLGEDPGQQIDEDLRRLKRVMEPDDITAG